MGLELVESVSAKSPKREWFEKLDADRKAEVQDWENQGWVLSRNEKDNSFQASKLFVGDTQFKKIEKIESLNVLLYKIEEVEAMRPLVGKSVESVPTFEISEVICSDCGRGNATKNGKCLICISRKISTEWEKSYLGDKDFLIPSDDSFEFGDFQAAPELEKIGKFLIDKYEDDFAHLEKAKILYRWKRKGGTSADGDVLGKLIKPTGLVKHFAETHSDDWDESVDYILWLAADHLRNRLVKARTIHAVIFKQLLHAIKIQNKFVLRGNEFAGFAREIEEFGFWKLQIKNIADAVKSVENRQGGLFDED